MPKHAPKPLTSPFRWHKRVLRPDEAVRYIDAAGFCMLFPVKNVPLPSLYYGITRRDPKLDFKWDRYAEMLWKWKGSLPKRKRVFYAKYFRGRGTFISLKQLPHFLAMREAAADPGDHEKFYAAGRITDDARSIWEALATHGPLATLELRNASKMGSKAGNVRFKRAMTELQCLLVVVHFGTEQETAAWASGKFELTCRAFPKATAAARDIAPEAARRILAAKFVELCPGSAPEHAARLFGWTKADAIAALAAEEAPALAKGADESPALAKVAAKGLSS
ncbi:MAG: AlkZ-related protein [Candidatus Acidiferrales bacterium]